QGTVVIQLAPEVAPVTVNNFVVLAIHGFYNGLNFWKAEDWVVQGGDPRGDGRGGPGYNLPDETTVTPWGLGAVGMARVPGGAVGKAMREFRKATNDLTNEVTNATKPEPQTPAESTAKGSSSEAKPSSN